MYYFEPTVMMLI